MFWNKWISLVFISVFKEISSQSDPCTNYNALANVTSKSDYRLHLGDTPVVTPQPVGWVRYTGNVNGSLMTDCPTGTECGVFFQYWMNDSLPAVEEGIVPKQICGSTGAQCCDVELMINVKNCSDFVVYELKPAAQGVRYCFAADAITTTSRTTTITTTTSTSNTTLSSDESEGTNITLITAMVGSVVLMVFLVIVSVCVKKKINEKMYIHY